MKSSNLSIKTLILLIVALLLGPIIGYLVYLDLEIVDISELSQQQYSAVSDQHRLLTRQAELVELQARVHQRQLELIAFMTKTESRIQLLERIQLEFSRLERATFSAALSRRMNQREAMLGQRQAFVDAVDAAQKSWPELTGILRAEYEAYTVSMDRVSRMLRSRNKRPAIKLYLEETKRISESVDSRVEAEILKAAELQSQRRKSFNVTIASLDNAAQEIEISGEKVKRSGTRVGALASTVAERVVELKWYAIAAVVVLLVVGPLVGRWLANSISSPLATLTLAMDQISNGNLEHRVDLRSNNEIGRLASGFNLMSKQLSRANSELHAHRDGLERKVAERTRDLEVAKNQAESASKAKSEFLATMSHEIRTPMNGVIGMTELLLSTDLSATQARFAATVHRSASALMYIIRDILDFSKIESGKMELHESKFELRKLIEDTAEIFAERADERKLELLCEVPPELPVLWTGDAERIAQIVNNLTSNAIKFTSVGEVRLKVTVERLGRDDADLRIAVLDTGIGLSAEEQSRVFESFEQADSSTTRVFGGTGLGLAICKQLVGLMQGSIGVDSEPDQGSEFWVRLTLPYHGSTTVSAEHASVKGVRALVVDDNATNREILYHQLRAWEMESVGVPSGALGLTALHEAIAAGQPFDMVVLDGHMPGMDGYEFAQHVSADRQLRGLPMLLLSSVCDLRSQEELAQAGIRQSLCKPARQAELLQSIVRMLSEHGEPASAAQPAPQKTVASERRVQSAFAAQVLLVEDNRVNQEVSVGILETLGCTVQVAEDGVQALSAIERQRFDLVLMDCQMPRMDGFTATRRIRSNETGGEPRLPIIALTANAMSGDRERCLQAGMDGYLTKPVSIADFEAALARHLPQSGVTASAPGADEAPAASGVLDPVALRNIRELNNGEAIAARVIDIYLTEAPQHMQELQHAVESDAAERLRAVAHKLKSASANVGATGAAALCADLEALGRSQTTAGAAELLADLRRSIAAVYAALAAAATGKAA